MQNKKSTSGRKLKNYRALLIFFICITLSCINILELLNLYVSADPTEDQTVEETVEYEEGEAVDAKAYLAENGENAVIVEFETPQIEVFVNIGTDKADILLPEELSAILEDGEKNDIPVTWDDGGLYDMDTPGTYIFTADIGSYIYAGENPTAIVTVEMDEELMEESEQQESLTESEQEESLTESEQQESSIESEQQESPIESEQQESSIESEQTVTSKPSAIGIRPATLIDPPIIDASILTSSNIAVINEDTGIQTGYTTLPLAMQAIGANSGNYTLVFVKNYNITASMDTSSTLYGKNANLTVTSTYKDAVTNETVTRVVGINNITIYWGCSGETTFKDIRFSTYLTIYANCNKLTIGTGVICDFDGGTIYGAGAYGASTGNSDITVLSGTWSYIIAGSYGTYAMNGNAVVNIGGTANLTGSSATHPFGTGVTGTTTVNIDGSEGAAVRDITASTTAGTGTVIINLNNAEITESLNLGNAKLNVSGTCTVGKAITSSLTIATNIKLNDGATLNTGAGATGSFNCPMATLIFGEGSSLVSNGLGTNRIANIVVEGSGAQLYVKQGYPITVSGTYSSDHKLTIDLTDNIMAQVLDGFLTFTTEANANTDDYVYPHATGQYDGILEIDGRIVYYDFIPPEGYLYNWYSATSIYVGGYDSPPSGNDLQCFFNFKAILPEGFGLSNDPLCLWSGQLKAKINNYMNGMPFSYYRDYFSPDFTFSLRVGDEVYQLVGNAEYVSKIQGDPVLRGYKKSADGSNLDFVFYLGEDVGIVYLHLTINPDSLIMSESWEYVNLSDTEQYILASHGGSIFLGINDLSYISSSTGQDIAYAFKDEYNPVMFMWVDQSTTPNPAVGGVTSQIDDAIRGGILYDDTIPRKATTIPTFLYGLGTQWQYSVAPGTTQSFSGGTSFSEIGSLQVRGRDITFKNPDKEDGSKTVSHSVFNASMVDIIINNVTYTGLPEGITVTDIPNSLTVPAGSTENLDFTYSVALTVPPGVYPVNYTVNGIYTFTDKITVLRDEVKITAAVKNEDNSENTTAISGISAAAVSPVAGTTIYKYYNGKLSWTLDSTQYEIKRITVGGTDISALELSDAKSNNYLTFVEMAENKDVVIYVGAPLNKVTVSKTVVGGQTNQSFAFTITVKDKDGIALADGTVLGCTGGTITGSGATAPSTTTLTLNASGQATFYLTNGQTLEIKDIPADGKIQVVETAVTGYETTHKVNDVASTVSDQKDTGLLNMGRTDKVIAFCNTALVDLTVNKTVEGQYGNKTKEFTFSISVKDKDGVNVTKDFSYEGGILTGNVYTGVTAPANGTLSVINGTGSFTLKHGQSITVKYLDPTYKIQITETDPGLSYITKYLKDGATITSRVVTEFTLGAEHVTIAYTNTRDTIPSTGNSTGSNIWIPVFGAVVVLCGISGFMVYRRKKVR